MNRIFRKNTTLLFLALILIFHICATSAFATTLAGRKVVCPICGTEFEITAIMSTNNFGGVDMDLLERARGTQPLLVLPATCPKCLYSGYRRDFSKNNKISKEVIEKIKVKKVLKPAIEITPETKRIPAWVKYDLIAQTYKLLGKEEMAIAQQYLSASWAVRLSEYPKTILKHLGEEDTKKALKLISDRLRNIDWMKVKNQALFEVELGREFRKMAKNAGVEEKILRSAAAIALLRMHGENPDVEEILKSLKGQMPDEKYNEFYKSVMESINREKQFQKKAIKLFEDELKKWDSKKVTGKKEEEGRRRLKAVITYLTGELYRRIGEPKKALQKYEAANKIKEAPDWLKKFIERQKKVATAKL